MCGTSAPRDAINYVNATTRAMTFDSDGGNASDYVTTLTTNYDDDEGDGDEYTTGIRHQTRTHRRCGRIDR